MVGPPSLKNEPASLLPGGVTYVADPNGQSFRPAIDVRLDLGALAADIAEVQGRIKEAFYANLFLMLEGRVSPAGRKYTAAKSRGISTGTGGARRSR